MGMREKLIELIRKADKEDHESLTQDVHYAFMADNLIANDVVPVVRCKDCRWFKQKGLPNRPYCNHPTTGILIPEESDFCSYGERRTDA